MVSVSKPFLRPKGGNAWYVNVKTSKHESKKQVPLKLYGGEDDRRAAVIAAQAMADRLTTAETQAVALIDARRTLAAAGIPVSLATPASTQTVSQWWDIYEAEYCGQKAASTLAIDTRVRVLWEPLIGSIRLVALEQTDLVRAQNTRLRSTHVNNPKKATAEGTVLREVRLIKAILNKAVQTRRIPFNPFTGAPALEDSTREDRVLTEEHEEAVYALFTTGRKDCTGTVVTMDARYQRFIRFMILTGCRLDEVRNTGFRGHKTWIRVVGKGSKPRELSLVPEAQTILAEQMKDQGHSVSPRPKGHLAPWWQDPQQFRDVCATLAERAGIPHFSPHDLRHTFGHRWLKAGRDLKLLSLILGHASVAVTERHYAYLGLSDVRARMAAVMGA